MFGYVTSLRTLSSGRATSTMEFSHYAATPSNVSEDVIKKQMEQLKLIKILKHESKIRIKLKSYDHSLVDNSADR